MIIPPRFNGPPDTANGGYTAGMLATYLDAPAGAVVTLRQPPPLGKPLDLRTGDGTIRVYDEERLIAEAAPLTAALDDTVPAASWAEATAAAERYPGFVDHPFATCFVCGTARAPGDGLRLFPGRLADGRTAAPWVVPDDFEPALMWAALDCPGGWSVSMESRRYVLGRIAARVDRLPAPGERCVVVGALVAEQGRKADVLSTVHSVDGAVLARARATWIALPESAPTGAPP